MENSKAKFEREMLLNGEKLSEDEMERLMAAHEQDAETLRRNMQEEKERQKKAIAEKVQFRPFFFIM